MPDSFASASSRRAFLRNASVCLALPAMESFGFRAFAAPKAVTPAKRMAFLYIPNGVNMGQWTINGGDEKNFELSPTLKTLDPFKNDFSVITNLAHVHARANGDGGGDHARASATFLTGCQAKKTAGSDIRIGVSVDQLAASQLGHQTTLPSLELSTDGERSSGRCDSGYSCAYLFNISWKTENLPLAPEMDPRLVFERLFGIGASNGNTPEGQRRRASQRSILDFVLDDAKSMQRKLSSSDNRKLDEYLSSVRDIELRIQASEKHKDHLPAGIQAPSGIPTKTQDHIRIMFDLLTLAFQTDTTRIATFLLAHDGSNRNFPEIGVPDAHHNLSHHQNDPAKLERIARIDRFYMEQLAYFLKRLKDTREGEQNLLDRSMIVYGGGISDGNSHSHSQLPVILAGHGGGTLNPGRHITAEADTPMTNLYLAMLDRMGVKAERIGDSTGVLEGI